MGVAYMTEATREDGTIINFLGGNNEKRIGENSILIEHTEKDRNTRIMMDLGALFPPDWTALDAVFPDVRSYFAHTEDGKEIPAEKPIDAIFISHCHEDHIGGLIHLARAGYQFPPIYTSKYTKELLKIAFKEAGVNTESLQINEIEQGQSIKVADNVTVSPFNVSHSTIGAMGYHIETRLNNKVCAGILNPGDYRLDESKIGPGFKEEEFAEFLQNKPVTHVLLDSTSTDNDDKYLVTFDEAVKNTLEQIEKHKDKQVISAVISRSVQNLAIDLEVAKQSGRKVFIDGYWAKLAFVAMQKSGVRIYDDVVFGSDDILHANAQTYLSKYGRSERYIIPSGAFAESKKGKKSGLYKMSEQQKVSVDSDGKVKGKGDTGHPDFTIDSYTVILARQRCIEDINGKQVRAMYQRLAALGATIIENTSANPIGRFASALMQRTGHAVKSETIKFIKMVKKYRKNKSKLWFLPIHGDYKQLINTAKVVTSAGGDPYICHNTDTINVYAGGIHMLPQSKEEPVYIAVQEDSFNGGFGRKYSEYTYSLVDKFFTNIKQLFKIRPQYNETALERTRTTDKIEKAEQLADEGNRGKMNPYYQKYKNPRKEKRDKGEHLPRKMKKNQKQHISKDFIQNVGNIKTGRN